LSEAVLAPIGLQAGHSAIARARRNRLSPLEALERGFALFQATFTTEAWRYYTGTAPLVICFIPLWVIDGQIRLSDGAILGEAALLAGAYLLRVWMVACYVQGVRESAFGVPTAKPAGALARAAALGHLLAWKIVLSAAALATLLSVAGAPWFYGACQFASLEGQEHGTEQHSFRGCLALAGQWYGGSLLLFPMLLPLWGAVWLNCLILAALLPQLLHSIFGVNTLLSTETGIQSLLQSSASWLALFAGAWLALDPVIKCTFVVVYQYLRSRREGDDLRGLLASLPREEQKKAEKISLAGTGRSPAVGLLAVLAVLLFVAPLSARAQDASPTESGTAQTAVGVSGEARVQQLRQALGQESERAVYRWHDAEHPSQPSWLDKLLNKVGDATSRGWRSFSAFIRSFMPKGLTFAPPKGNQGAWRLQDLRLWIGLILVLSLSVGAFLIWRRRQRQTVPLSVPVGTAPLPDLSDASIATDYSEDEWFALANRLESEGELRLALRAAYLGLLAGLSQREWLTIRRDRTNREYLNEFTRRWGRRPQAAVETRAEIPEKLRGSLRLFDRVWYGSYALTPGAVSAYRQDQRELLNHV
jgi:hypothetical protein